MVPYFVNLQFNLQEHDGQGKFASRILACLESLLQSAMLCQGPSEGRNALALMVPRIPPIAILISQSPNSFMNSGFFGE